MYWRPTRIAYFLHRSTSQFAALLTCKPLSSNSIFVRNPDWTDTKKGILFSASAPQVIESQFSESTNYRAMIIIVDKMIYL
jgi:hypothetical protein